MEEIDKGDYSSKTFYVDDPQESGNRLIIFTFSDGNVSINNGILINDEVRISKQPTPFKFNTICTTENTQTTKFRLAHDFKNWSIFLDSETAEEVKPTLVYDEETDQVLLEYEFVVNKSYLAFSIIEGD